MTNASAAPRMSPGIHTSIRANHGEIDGQAQDDEGDDLGQAGQRRMEHLDLPLERGTLIDQYDPGDGGVILELLLTHPDKFRRLQPDTVETRKLQFLTEERRRLVNQHTSESQRLIGWLKQTFPQILEWFENPACAMVGALLLRWPTRSLQTGPLADGCAGFLGGLTGGLRLRRFPRFDYHCLLIENDDVHPPVSPPPLLCVVGLDRNRVGVAGGVARREHPAQR